MTKKQEKLYNSVIEHILEEPKRINMNSWALNPDLVDEDMRPQCNTVGCFAGWAYFLSEKVKDGELHRVDSMNIEDTAQAALGLTVEQAGRLFYPSSWPRQWRLRRDRYEAGTPKYAKVVADYAKWLLKEIKKEKA